MFFKKPANEHGHHRVETFRMEDEEYFNGHARTIKKAKSKLSGINLAYRFAYSHVLQDDQLEEWKLKLAATQLDLDSLDT
ncbi:hypothetical protein SARC_09068 [Sphaeroforma arctica JP610]|uniref:Uncharacterized protein n=1 Tax=Sphaeroforma arctica JP610 TaxID=667725 RepID=A0A0L0FNU7_9EUKA|nr:hypothetical protein SARC_09068 [Sphaeroforma arctica JP610]KNC78510.1 hypothetical protein SARC_09068 [Sphaeroforma arctica JP610]|eukprot:XP_014152412.1 hypothetical protein SARC_09068 [Sphaeroforma arctica JP610]